jgi:hypothetical protein
METIGRLQSQNAREEAVIRALRRAYDENVHGRFLAATATGARYLGEHGYYAVSTER